MAEKVAEGTPALTTGGLFSPVERAKLPLGLYRRATCACAPPRAARDERANKSRVPGLPARSLALLIVLYLLLASSPRVLAFWSSGDTATPPPRARRPVHDTVFPADLAFPGF